MVVALVILYGRGGKVNSEESVTTILVADVFLHYGSKSQVTDMNLLVLMKMISYFTGQDMKFVVYWQTVQSESS